MDVFFPEGSSEEERWRPVGKALPLKELKAVLLASGVDISTCIEKSDLVDKYVGFMVATKGGTVPPPADFPINKPQTPLGLHAGSPSEGAVVQAAPRPKPRVKSEPLKPTVDAKLLPEPLIRAKVKAICGRKTKLPERLLAVRELMDGCAVPHDPVTQQKNVGPKTNAHKNLVTAGGLLSSNDAFTPIMELLNSNETEQIEAGFRLGAFMCRFDCDSHDLAKRGFFKTMIALLDRDKKGEIELTIRTFFFMGEACSHLSRGTPQKGDKNHILGVLWMRSTAAQDVLATLLCHPRIAEDCYGTRINILMTIIELNDAGIETTLPLCEALGTATGRHVELLHLAIPIAYKFNKQDPKQYQAFGRAPDLLSTMAAELTPDAFVMRKAEGLDDIEYFSAVMQLMSIMINRGMANEALEIRLDIVLSDYLRQYGTQAVLKTGNTARINMWGFAVNTIANLCNFVSEHNFKQFVTSGALEALVFVAVSYPETALIPDSTPHRMVSTALNALRSAMWIHPTLATRHLVGGVSKKWAKVFEPHAQKIPGRFAPTTSLGLLFGRVATQDTLPPMMRASVSVIVSEILENAANDVESVGVEDPEALLEYLNRELDNARTTSYHHNAVLQPMWESLVSSLQIFLKSPRVCHLPGCGRTEGEGGSKKLLKCSSCVSVFYCSAAHQKEDWSQHKTVCQQLKAERQQKEMASRAFKEMRKTGPVIKCAIPGCNCGR